MENKLFKLKLFTVNSKNDGYWDYDSSGENYIVTYKTIKSRIINKNNFGFRLNFIL